MIPEHGREPVRHDLLDTGDDTIVELESLMPGNAYSKGVRGIDITVESGSNILFRWSSDGDAPAGSSEMQKIDSGTNRVFPFQGSDMHGKMYVKIPADSVVWFFEYR